MKYLVYLFFILCLFPYLDFLQLGTDTQPNALLVGIVLLIGIRNKKINAPLVLLWLVFICSIFLVFYNNVSFFDYLKNTFNYLSPPLIATVTYLILNQLKYKISFRFFFSAISIYAIIGLVQLYFIPDFLTFLVNMARGTLSGGRGVVSLFSEPAYYGSTCLLFMAFSLLSYTRKQNLWVGGLLFFQLVFLSRSATAIAIFLAAIGLFTLLQLLRFRLRYLMGSVVGLSLATMLLFNYWNKIESTRAGELAQVFIENPLLITQIDGSVGIRFTGTVAPFLSMRHNYFMPQGLGYYTEFLKKFSDKGMYRSFLSVDRAEKKPKLSGSLNMVLYQLGFIGLFLPLALYLAFRGQLREDAVLLAFLLLVVTMMTQIQMMNAMIGLVIGAAIYQGKLKSRNKNQVALTVSKQT